jgi:uncharacterized delta-60 repeat protein
MILLSLAGRLIAAPGDVDFGFDPGSQLDAPVETLVQQADGKIIIGGYFQTVRGATRSGIARLNPDGSADSTFDPGSGADASVESVHMQSDGSFIVSGNFRAINGKTSYRIARLNADGSFDSSFNSPLGSENSIDAVALQADSKILLAGSFAWTNEMFWKGVVRLNTDGSLDKTFVTNEFVNVYTIAVQADQKILVGGDFGAEDLLQPRQRYITRLKSDGTFDKTFRSPIGRDQRGVIWTILPQEDGKIVIAGKFSITNVFTQLARLNPDGTLDWKLSQDTPLGDVFKVAQQHDGNLLVGWRQVGLNGKTEAGIRRITAGGELDSTYNVIANESISSLVVQADESVIVGGGFTAVNRLNQGYLARLSPDGKILDPTFRPGLRVPGRTVRIVIQPDKKVLLLGLFALSGESSNHWILRLNENGALDESFDVREPNGPIASVAFQSDGKMIVAGPQVARLNQNGSLDSSFVPMVNGLVSGMALQKNGRIVLGYFFAQNIPFTVSRLTSDGNLDTTFNCLVTDRVKSLLIQPDDKVLIWGDFVGSDGATQDRVVRVNSDGTTDEGFVASVLGDTSPISSLALQPDGKVLIAGWFKTVDGVDRNGIARLNANGTLDTTFHPDAKDGPVNSVALQKDGKMVCGGFFTDASGGAHGRVFRLNSDGALDTTFNSGSGPNSLVWSVAVAPDGKLLIGGDFTLYNGTARAQVVRLWGDPTLDAQRDGSDVVLTWSDAILQSAISVNGQYINVSGAASPYKIGTTEIQRYFRLQSK